MEEEDLNAEIFFVRSNLFARVEFATLVDVFTTAQALHGERSHESDGLNSRPGSFGPSTATDVIGIEVGGVVFLKDFTLRHCEIESKRLPWLF